MTREQIQGRLRALQQYEFALLSSMPDEGELTDRELTRLLAARAKLNAALAALKE
jgi:hypothetical protein